MGDLVYEMTIQFWCKFIFVVGFLQFVRRVDCNESTNTNVIDRALLKQTKAREKFEIKRSNYREKLREMLDTKQEEKQRRKEEKMQDKLEEKQRRKEEKMQAKLEERQRRKEEKMQAKL